MTVSVGMSDRELFRERPDPRRAYRVVDLFEAELCAYTGARYAVTVSSCTNALFLALTYWRTQPQMHTPAVKIPRHTYVGVLQAALNAGFQVFWHDEEWQTDGWYTLQPTHIIDAARAMRPGMYRNVFRDDFVCLSFHAAKQLPIGRGGAILTKDEKAADWFRAARMDGRPPGSDKVILPGWHMPLPPDAAARGLDILSRWNDAGYTPPPLPETSYPDLSLWHP